MQYSFGINKLDGECQRAVSHGYASARTLQQQIPRLFLHIGGNIAKLGDQPLPSLLLSTITNCPELR